VRDDGKLNFNPSSSSRLDVALEKIAAVLGRSKEVRVKMKPLKWVVVDRVNFKRTTTKLPVNNELQSVEETLKPLNAAVKALATEELDKTEILRFRTIIHGARITWALADCIDYRGTYVVEVSLILPQLTAYDGVWLEAEA
jgi:hypothetical protein